LPDTEQTLLGAAPRTTSYTLGEDLDEFVHAQVESGYYASASEVVRAALTLLANEQRKEQALLTALPTPESIGAKAVRRPLGAMPIS
jgi:antitoxin ParD1/3/4